MEKTVYEDKGYMLGRGVLDGSEASGEWVNEMLLVISKIFKLAVEILKISLYNDTQRFKKITKYYTSEVDNHE